MSKDRFQQGLLKLRELEGNAADEALASLDEISPDLMRYCIEYPLGDIYSRPGLDLKTREIAMISALIVSGNAALQLQIHLKAALRIGCTKDEIKEAIIQTSIVAGFPAAINAMLLAKEIFNEKENKKEAKIL